jgi:hypothetical protein
VSLLQLEGEVDNSEEVIESLRRENRRLDEALRVARLDLAQAKADNKSILAGVQELRRVLNPLHRGLMQIYGELDEMPGVDEAASSSRNPKWEDWKRRMPGRPAEVIELLQVNGEMSVQNIMTALRAGKNSVYQIMSKLGQAGVTKCTGGRYSLKEI